ncbi:hypothetical protein F8S13_14645 [Chloroflexia bacterium SDU3-3]|nr:hypothetical protein F8S13_14645 [Chloroflexia bacterium SDU3-3]
MANYDDLRDAIVDDDADLVKSMLDAGAYASACDEEGTSLLHWAVQEASGEIVELLVEAGADVNEPCYPTHLANACGDGNLPMVQTLVDLGAALDLGAPLHTAAAYGHDHIVGYLLDQGADVNGRDHEGRTPLFFAAMHGDELVARVLLARGADREARDYDGRRSVDEARDAEAESPNSYASLIALLG